MVLIVMSRVNWNKHKVELLRLMPGTWWIGPQKLSPLLKLQQILDLS